MRFDPSTVHVLDGLLLVKLSVQSLIVCFSGLMFLIRRLQGAGSCWHRFSGVLSKLVSQLSRVSRW